MTEEKKKRGCLFWVLIAIGVIVVLGVIGTVFGPTEEEMAEIRAEREAEEATERAEEAERQAQEAADLRASAIKVTARELASAYEANEAAAQQRYSNQLLEVSGTIDGVILDFMDKPVVQLTGTNQFLPVSINLTEETQDQAASYSKGERQTFLCERVSEVISAPQLAECVPVE